MSGSIMQFNPVTPIDPDAAYLKHAQVLKTGAETGLIGAQTEAVPSEIALRQAQAGLAIGQTGAIPSQIALRGAQAYEAQQRGAIGIPAAAEEQTARARIGIPAEAARSRAEADIAIPATAGVHEQDAYAKRLDNLQTQYGLSKSGLVGAVPPPPLQTGNQPLPIGPAVAPDAVPFIPPEGRGFLRALSPSEAPAANVRYVPPGSNRPATFDPSQGHPGQGAAGLYQWMPGTWQTAAKGAGVDPGNMSQGNQDRAAWWLSQKNYHDLTGGDLATDLRSGGHEAEITAAMNATWPSLTGGSQQNKTGATFIQRLPLTVQHEIAGVGKAPPDGVPGPDARSGVVPPAAPGTAQPPAPVGANPNAQVQIPPPTTPQAAPSGTATKNEPVEIPGMPGPVPGTLAVQPGGLKGTPDQRREFQINRANNMATIFSSAPDAPAGVQAMSDAGYLTPQQKDYLLANPDKARNFLAQQLPIKDRVTPEVQSQIKRDDPIIDSDMKKNEANVDTGFRAAQDQYNLKNIKTLVSSTPDDLFGAAAQTRLAIQAYATQFGGKMLQDLSSKLTGVEKNDVPVLQELQKAFLSNVLSNERTQGVQRIGALSTQYFQKASPAIDMTKPAIDQITNIGLVAQQMARDFANASNNEFSTNRRDSTESLVKGPYQQYKSLSDTLEKEWLSPDSPHGHEVYEAAANLLNKVPPDKAFKEFGTTGVGYEKRKEAVAIALRVDPQAFSHMGLKVGAQ